MNKKFVVGFGILISGFLLAGSRTSSGTQDVRQPKLQYEVRVAQKLIQVSVLDKSGNPVTDLAKEEFELSDNGKRVAFDQFERRTMGVPLDELSSQPGGQAINRRFFLIFDFSLSGVRGLQKAKQAGLKFLDEVLQPRDEVAMVTFTMPVGMRVHEYLTMDHERIRKAVEGLGTGPLVGRAENLARFWVSQADRAAQKGRQELGEMQDYEYAAQYGDLSALNADKKMDSLNQALQFSKQLRTLAKSLRSVPGTKNVILFSDGIPRQILYGTRTRTMSTMSEATSADQYAAQNSAFSETQVPRQNTLNAYQKMMEEFKTSNCPVYTFDTGESRAGADISVMEGMEGGGQISSSSGETLREIANITGGRYLGNTSDTAKAVQSVKNITGAVYVLGYPVKDTWDGKYHKIKVKVLRKGCDVIAQTGYYNPKPYSEYSTDDKLFQLMDLALSDNPQFLSPGGDLPFVVFPVWDQGWSYAAGIARVSGERTAEILGKDVETFLLVLNAKNDILSISNMSFGGAAPSKGDLDGRFVIPMKPGSYTFRIVARNRTSGWGARGNSTLVISDASAAAAWVDPPLLLMPASQVVVAEATPAMALSTLYPYDTAGYMPALGPIPAGTLDLWAVLRCSGALAQADLSVSGTLAAGSEATGTAVPMTILKQQPGGSAKCLFVQFPVSGLLPGTYTLTFEVKEANGFLNGKSAVSFKIK